jgi:O-antigen ligase
MFHNIAGGSHLLIGYTMSALFAYNLLKFINDTRVISKILYLGLMAFNILLIVFSGSRGALVSIVMIFFIATFKYLFNKRRIFY